MTVESTIYEALKSLVGNRVYPDVAPPNTTRPYITYQQIGGRPINFVEAAVPSMKNGRWQINVWADTRASAAAISQQASDALKTTIALNTTILNEPIATFDEETGYRGTIQDFSFWFAS